MFGVEHQMDPVKRERLERSWAHQYHLHALSLIDETRFAKYFHEQNGRPNKSVRMVVSVLVLKEMFDLTDMEALEALEWNTAWHYALDIKPEDAHTCQKTLHNFRKLLLQDDQGAGLFEGTTARVINAAGLNTRHQRQDSTHILSNIKVLTRLGLFVQTITHFLRELRRDHSDLYEALDPVLHARYLDREGYFADAKRTEAKRRLNESAVDLWRLVTRFAKIESVAAMDSFRLLSRLYTEQCVPPESEAVEQVELKKDVESSSLQSPSDPDVTYGHKGKGYEVQLTETCAAENAFQVITTVAVHGAHESDQHQVVPAIEQNVRVCGAAPETMAADAGYGSGENIVEAKAQGMDLLTPIGSKGPTGPVSAGDFEFDSTGDRVLRCPSGHEPDRHQASRTGDGQWACFSSKHCRTCPLRDACPTEKRKGRRVLWFNRSSVAVARRRKEQETAEFKTAYKIRSGIEATNSELKRRHGMGKLRVRGKPKVDLSVRLKALALNVKRYVVSLVDRMTETAEPAPACGC
jgi:hypothetical protein